MYLLREYNGAIVIGTMSKEEKKEIIIKSIQTTELCKKGIIIIYTIWSNHHKILYDHNYNVMSNKRFKYKHSITPLEGWGSKYVIGLELYSDIRKPNPYCSHLEVKDNI